MFPHTGELSRVTRILLAGPIFDLCLDGGSPITWIGMITQELRALASLRRQFLEKIRQCDRIDPCLPQNDCANRVGLCFVAARILQHQCSRSELDSGLSCSACNSAQLAGSSAREPCQTF